MFSPFFIICNFSCFPEHVINTDSTVKPNVKTTDSTVKPKVFNSDSTIMPKVGSYYYYKKYIYNSKYDTKEIIDVFDSVIASRIEFEGKNNVIKVVSSTNVGKSFYFYNFESNGNVSLYYSARLKWITFPLNGKDSILFISESRTYLEEFNNRRNLEHKEYTYSYFKNIGVDTNKVGSEYFVAQKLIGKIIVKIIL